MSVSSPALAPTALAATENRQEAPERLSLAVRLTTLVVVIVPFLGLVTGISLLWGWGFSWVELGLLVGMYAATVLGITVGFHRLFTHRAFEANPVVQYILVILGSMAIQAPLLRWVAVHRLHHHHSDSIDDPHSPHHHGDGILGLLRGMWRAHMGWFFETDPPNLAHYVQDLNQSKLLRNANALTPLWIALGLLIPTVLGGVLTGSWMGAVFGLIWGGLARVCLVHHVTWSINSVCHVWGRRTYKIHDQSRDNLLFGILAFGEGWHNSHHAFPTSARHGLRWWQIDISYCVIRGLALVGLAWKVKLPPKRAVTGGAV